MKLFINQIKVKKRVRGDLGDMVSLMKSLQHHGLLNPVVVNDKHELIAGYRRLEAARRLGWSAIEVTVVKKATEAASLAMEIDENTQRKDFSPEELAEARARLEKLLNPSLVRRLINALKSVLGRFLALFRKT